MALVQAYLNLGRIKRGDRIGVSALTWSTTVMPLIQFGLEPVPIDVDLSTLNVDSSHLLEAIKKYKIKTYFGTNVLGFCSDLDKIAEICEKNDILFFEDNCESLGSVYKGKLLGNFGNASTVSFYVGHHLSAIEGGAVCTDDDDLYQMLSIVRSHGWDRNLPIDRQRKLRKKFGTLDAFYDKYTFYDLGFNLRPTEITGFLIKEGLKHIDEIITKRENNFFEIQNHITKVMGDSVYPIKYQHIDRISNFAIPVIAKDKFFFDKLIATFLRHDIEVRPIIAGNLVLQPFFRKYIKTHYDDNEFKNVNIIHRLGFYFGNNHDLNRKEINYMKSIISMAK